MEKFEIHPAIRSILKERGCRTEEDIEEFLSPLPKRTYDPFRMKGMSEAVDRIIEYVEQGRRICIYGDYDADGVASVSLLYGFLSALTNNVAYYIPSRFSEGYGLNMDSVRRISEDGAELIITVDCGCVSFAEVECIKELGMEVIVTDHHNVDDRSPDCIMLNPKQPDDDYPFSGLCGCGVAFKLAQALQRRLKLPKSEINCLLDLVGIATIGDIVPLVDENRTLVKYGFDRIGRCQREGLSMLIDGIGLDARKLSSTNVAFGIVPHLNAAGRMKNALLGVRLLTGDTQGAGAVNDIKEDEDFEESGNQATYEKKINTLSAGGFGSEECGGSAEDWKSEADAGETASAVHFGSADTMVAAKKRKSEVGAGETASMVRFGSAGTMVDVKKQESEVSADETASMVRFDGAGTMIDAKKQESEVGAGETASMVRFGGAGTIVAAKKQESKAGAGETASAVHFGGADTMVDAKKQESEVGAGETASMVRFDGADAMVDVKKQESEVSAGETASAVRFGSAGTMAGTEEQKNADVGTVDDVSERTADLAVLVEELKALNNKRKAIQDQIYQKACKEIEASGRLDDFILYDAGDSHEGVTGIVAGKLKETYYRPVIIVTDTADPEYIKGTGRSIDGVDLHGIMSESAQLFKKFGGHAGACGFTMKREYIGKLHSSLKSGVRRLFERNPALFENPVLCDARISSSDVTLNFATQVAMLEPFGEGNQEPVFEIDDVTVTNVVRMGDQNQYLKLNCAGVNGTLFDTVWFDVDEKRAEHLTQGVRLQLKGSLGINRWQGRESVQCVLKDFSVI